MNKEFWQNRTVQFAVGVTAIFLLVRWLLTGDLLMAVEAARPPVEGEVKSLSIWSVVWPMIVEACVVVGASTIAFVLGIWEKLAELFAGLQASASVPNVSVTAIPEGGQDLALALARAAAAKDDVEAEKLRVAIRKPYAIEELRQALQEGDLDKVDPLVTELKAIVSKGKK